MDHSLQAWLQAQKDQLDNLIFRAANRYYVTQRDYRRFTNLDHDIEATTQESFNLSAGHDLCYDRPTIGYTYSLWYHARRVNTFLRYFAQELLAADPAVPLDVFDLGAGTGAVQWAVGLVYAGLKACGRPVPRLHIINVDSSAFMLEYNRDYLWEQFRIAYPACAEIACSFSVNSWNTPAEGHSGGAAWVVSSYLFDHAENKEFLADGFQALVRLYKPDRLLLLTSSQAAKTRQLQQVAEAVKAVGYQVAAFKTDNPLFTGGLPQVTRLRRALRERRQLPGIPHKEVTWDDHSFSALALTRTQSALAFAAESPAAIREWSLYLAPLVVRRDIALNEQQRKAAEHTNRPTIISGPAGCGKSVVITERIRNLVEERGYDPKLQLLLCSFNKALIATLTQWLRELLDEKRCTPTQDGFRFSGSGLRNITCLWFDVLPTRLGNLKGHLEEGGWHFVKMRQAAQRVRQQHQVPARKHEDILHPDFLLEEFHRVYYGLGYDAAGDYLTQPRPGRGKAPKLDASKTRRQLVAACFDLYLFDLQQAASYTSKRLNYLQQLRQGGHLKYDYVFVDEFQDCTPADFEIFQHLLHNPDHLILAGDLAQSVQIGRTSAAKVPRLEGMVQRRVPHRLQGSYRLPFRISEAIRGISEHINTLYEGDNSAGVIAPYKGSPPGARPVVVYADTLPRLADKLAEAIQAYSCFALKEITVMERDSLLQRALKERLNDDIPTETETILKLKGLEKTCVVWSTRAAIEHQGEVFEFIYTVLTRTSCLLLITLTPDMQEMYLPVLQQLRADRLIFWDAESSQQFVKLQSKAIAAVTIDSMEELED